jgi:hypothetical protein
MKHVFRLEPIVCERYPSTRCLSDRAGDCVRDVILAVVHARGEAVDVRAMMPRARCRDAMLEYFTDWGFVVSEDAGFFMLRDIRINRSVTQRTALRRFWDSWSASDDQVIPTRGPSRESGQT